MNDDELDQLIRGLPREVPSPNFLRNLREIPLRHAHPTPTRTFWSSVLWGLGLAASLGLGLVTGGVLDETDSTTVASAASSERSDDELEDALGLVSSEDEGLEL